MRSYSTRVWGGFSVNALLLTAESRPRTRCSSSLTHWNDSRAKLVGITVNTNNNLMNRINGDDLFECFDHARRLLTIPWRVRNQLAPPDRREKSHSAQWQFYRRIKKISEGTRQPSAQETKNIFPRIEPRAILWLLASHWQIFRGISHDA